MSLHAQISPEAQAKLAAQKRNSTISAIIMALLICCLLGVILWIISLAPMFKNNEETVSYSASSDADVEVTKPEMTNQVETKPSAPASSMAKVIASQVSSPVSIPVPEISASEPALDFGDGDDFGDGWGSDFGSGSGAGSGGASFFKQKIKAERICYVVDYSKSMKGGGKIDILKEELAKSVAALPDGIEYQLIFFAGPGWVAGSEVTVAGKNKSAVVEFDKKKYKWENQGKNDWERKGSKQKVQWLTAGDSVREESLKAIKDTDMVWGTTWRYPLEMAIEMSPSPNHIFFMTDGAPGTGIEGALDTAKDIGRKAKSKKIIINTIALKIPITEEALKEMSERTGGQYKLVK